MAIKRDSADKHFSLAVRERDKHLCRFCGGEGTDCAHIFGRRIKAVRWSMDNAICLCRYHHNYFGENPIHFHDFLKQILGQDHLDSLRVKAAQVYKTNEKLRKEISKHYREQLKIFYSDPSHQIESWN